MVIVQAYIKLYKGDDKRQSPIFTGYRPLFEFVKESKVSGQIELKDRYDLEPGAECMTKISFISDQFLGEEFEKGKKFLFYESQEPLGEGEIIEILIK